MAAKSEPTSYTPSAGISFQWNGAFAAVKGLSWTGASGYSKGRSVLWTDEAGDVSITSYFRISQQKWGQVARLVITGGNADFSGNAVLLNVSCQPELNGLTTYTANFKVLE